MSNNEVTLEQFSETLNEAVLALRDINESLRAIAAMSGIRR